MAPRFASAFLTALTLSPSVLAKTNIASWNGLRGVQIRSIIALEGGLITNGTFSGGQWQNTQIRAHPNGVYYQIDLTKSFNATAQSTDDILIPGSQESSDTHAPNYINGGMLNNDYQWYTFGGQADQPPIGVSVNQGNVFPSNPSQTVFSQGVSPENNHQTVAVNDNITAGAYASSADPKQALGWYFSGMVSGNRTELLYNSGDTSPDHPTVASNTFFKVDMTNPSAAQFESLTWPEGTDPRAEGGLVWLPFGKQGVLLAVGGAAVPRDLFVTKPTGMSNNTWMTDLMIYDIAGDTWYPQSTLETGGKPSQLAKFCTAVVPTQDGKSQEIFVYGGYDGTYKSASPINDDVWVLSVPAFQWTKVVEAAIDSTHGRQGNVCFSPNPSTMITVGGTDMLGGSLNSDTIIDVLDLNTLQWTGNFDASSKDPFVAPDAVVKQLGWSNANGPGSASVTGLNGSALNDLFSTAYPGTVRTYYPYTNGTAGNNSSNTTTTTTSHKSNNWKVPVIATLCTVIPGFVIALALFFCIRRRRQAVKQTKQSRSTVFSWLGKADPKMEKSETSDGTAVESQGDYFAENKDPQHQVFEAEASNPTSPGWSQAGTMALVSPSINETHEIYTQPPREGELMHTSMSARNHPYYPRSLSGNHIIPAHTHTGSGSLSRFSEGLPTSPEVRYELPHNRSNEDVTGTLMTTASDTLSPQTATTDPVSATSDATQTATPKPVAEAQTHNRNQSSLSSNASSLTSPGIDEENRRSRAIDKLPDIPASPVDNAGEGETEKT